MPPPGRLAPNYLSDQDIAGYWLRGGGNSANVVAAVAVAAAESSRDTHALSPTGAVGLWQIEYFHAENAGYDAASLYDPAVNAFFAITLSGNGTNWIDFDTAYAEGENLTVRRNISYPEPGSRAYSFVPEVAAALGVTGGGGGGPPQDVQNPGGGGAPPTEQGGPGGVGFGSPTIGVPPQAGGGGTYQGIPSISVPYAGGGGWDNLRQYWTSDQQQLFQYFQTISRLIGGSLG